MVSKLGFENIKVIDYDKIEKVNIPNQFYREKDIGELKVNALKDIVKDFTGLEIETINEKIEESTEFNFINLNTIVVFCLDNIETRKLIYEKIKDFPITLIDTRMGGEGYQIYNIDLSEEEEKKEYEKRLELITAETPCGEKSVIYTILSISSETCNLIKRIDKEQETIKTLKREMKTYNFINN